MVLLRHSLEQALPQLTQSVVVEVQGLTEAAALEAQVVEELLVVLELQMKDLLDKVLAPQGAVEVEVLARQAEQMPQDMVAMELLLQLRERVLSLEAVAQAEET
jgi:hypothetical protein